MNDPSDDYANRTKEPRRSPTTDDTSSASSVVGHDPLSIRHHSSRRRDYRLSDGCPSQQSTAPVSTRNRPSQSFWGRAGFRTAAVTCVIRIGRILAGRPPALERNGREGRKEYCFDVRWQPWLRAVRRSADFAHGGPDHRADFIAFTDERRLQKRLAIGRRVRQTGRDLEPRN